jgi:hypothetical protein
VIVWRFIFKWSGRTRKRSAADGVLRTLLTGLNVPQLQYALGTTAGTYRTWCGHAKQAPNVEEIGEGANLLWIGERRLEKVILFFHGESTPQSIQTTYSCIVGAAFNVRYGHRWWFPSAFR